MPEGHVEVERRYDVAAGCVVPDLSVLPETASVEQATESRLSATYFDTEDLRLLHAHVTLHRCTGGGDEGWHLGLPADETSRDELPLPLDAGSDETVPQKLLDRLRGQLRGRPVRPVAGLRTRRVVRRLFASDGRQLA